MMPAGSMFKAITEDTMIILNANQLNDLVRIVGAYIQAIEYGVMTGKGNTETHQRMMSTAESVISPVMEQVLTQHETALRAAATPQELVELNMFKEDMADSAILQKLTLKAESGQQMTDEDIESIRSITMRILQRRKQR